METVQIAPAHADRVGATRPSPAPRRLLLAGPIACGCLLLGAAGYVAAVDPAASGSLLPACPFYELTGLWCPGCGLTRATHAVLRGHVVTALRDNLFFPIFLSAIVVAWFGWLRSSAGLAPMRWLSRIPAWSGAAFGLALLVYGVLRNLPAFSMFTP